MYRDLPPSSIRFFAPIESSPVGELAARYASAMVTAELELCLVAARATMSAPAGKFHGLADCWEFHRHRLLKVPPGPFVNVVMAADVEAWRRLWTLPVAGGCVRNVLINPLDEPRADVVDVIEKYDLVIAPSGEIAFAWRAVRSLTVIPPDESLKLRGFLF